ncbi:MAG: glycosyltransferase family 39 protein, partial [bacterium]
MDETRQKTFRANANTVLIAIALILLAGSALRLWGLGREPFSTTEAFNLATASQPKEVLKNIYKNGGDKFIPAPMPFTLVARNYTAPDSTETAARLPEAALGVVSLILVFLIARRIAGTGPAALTMLFLALSPYVIQFNRAFSHHSLVFFLMAASIWTCLRAIDAEKPLVWCAVFGGAYLLCVMFFPAALCLFIPLNLIFIIFGPRGARDRAVWAAANIAALCAGVYFLARWLPALLERPEYSIVFRQFVDSRLIPVPQFFAFHFVELYFQLFGGAGGFFAFDSANPNLGQIGSFFLLPVVFHIAFFYGFKPRPGDQKQRTIVFLLLAFTFPVSAVLLFLGMPLGEALLPLLPAFPLALSIGFFRNDSRRFRWAFAITLFCVAAGSMPDAYRIERERIPWREVAAYIEEKAEPEDPVVILDGWISGPFLY